MPDRSAAGRGGPLFTVEPQLWLRPGGGAHPGRPVDRPPRRDPRPLPRRAGRYETGGPDAMKPDFQCVRTHWIRGFMALPEGRPGSRTPRCARGRSGSR
jgi:hypothetical protein